MCDELNVPSNVSVNYKKKRNKIREAALIEGLSNTKDGADHVLKKLFKKKKKYGNST